MTEDKKYQLRKIQAVLSSDLRSVELQFKLLSILLIYKELLCNTVIEKTKSFFSSNYSFDESGQIKSHPEQEYFDLIRGKGVFRGCRDFHLEVGAITKDDDLLLDKIMRERNRAAHEIVEVLLNDEVQEIDYEIVFAAVRLFNKIDNWWIVNLEIATDPDFEASEADLTGAASLQASILNQLIRSVFNFDGMDSETSKNL